MTEETKHRMEFGAGAMSPRHERKRALLWRLHLVKQARREHASQLRRKAKERFNTNNNPLGS